MLVTHSEIACDGIGCLEGVFVASPAECGDSIHEIGAAVRRWARTLGWDVGSSGDYCSKHK